MLQLENLLTETSFSSLIKDLAVYNHWANERLVDWLKSKPSNLLEIEIPSSFAGIKATLLHIWDVERNWFAHLMQEPVTPFRWEGFNGTLDDIIENIVEQSQQFTDYIQTLSDEELNEGCFFSIPYVGDHTMSRFEIIQHTFNHSTYHRGQLTTIGHHIGLHDAPMTDYMFYLLRVKGK